MRQLILLLVLGVALATACDEEREAPRSDWGYRYFPLALDQEWQYAMDSITLRPDISGIRFDSVRLSVREVLVDTLRDLEGKLWYRGERYDRPSDTVEWRFRQTFLLSRDEQRAFRQEDNLEFVKLIFPPESGEQWSGNRAFDPNRVFVVGGQDLRIFNVGTLPWTYEYLTVDQTETIEGGIYDSVAVVQAANSDEAFSRRYATEMYARDQGLIYREMEVFQTNCEACCFFEIQVVDGDTFSVAVANRVVNGVDTTIACADLPWRERAERGFVIRQWLVE